MATITLQGNPINTNSTVPAVGAKAAAFTLVDGELANRTLADFAGKRKVISIFPSIDTGVCATSVKTFNEKAAGLDNTVVLCVSNDLPFAMSRFCGADNLTNVVPLSGFRSTFATDYGVAMTDGPLEGLTARAVVVLDGNDTVLYSQLVGEIAEEPNYDAALASLG